MTKHLFKPIPKSAKICGKIAKTNLHLNTKHPFKTIKISAKICGKIQNIFAERFSSVENPNGEIIASSSK